MEHRNGRRTTVRFKVDLWQRQLYLGRCNAMNLSAGGLFLEMPGVRKIKPGLVELRLWIDGAGPQDEQEEFCLKALVVHRQGRGIGLMWADFDLDQSVSIQKIVALAA